MQMPTSLRSLLCHVVPLRSVLCLCCMTCAIAAQSQEAESVTGEVPEVAAADENPLVLELTSIKGQWTVNELVKVTLELQAGQSRRTDLWGFDADRTVTFEAIRLTNEGQESVPKTLYSQGIEKKQRTKMHPYEKVSLIIEPEKKAAFTFNLSRRLDLTLPGTYEVTAKVRWFAPDSQDVVHAVSKPLSIEVKRPTVRDARKNAIH